MSSPSEISALKRAVRTEDPAVIKKAVEVCKASGMSDRQCYRVGLAADADITEMWWKDMMARAGVTVTSF